MKSKMETKEKLNDLLKQVAEIVPTILFIGKTADKQGALLMGSPEKTDDMREADIVTAVCMMIADRKDVRAMLFSAVCWYMQANPKYRDRMQKVLNELKERDEHQRTAEPE